MVDGYGNIYAPLLPLLIPQLSLTLAAAGTLTMLFQMAASVAQVGFGHLADRWRPRTADHGRARSSSVCVLSLIGLATSTRWRSRPSSSSAGWARRRFIRRRRRSRIGSAASRRGLAMSVYITGGTLGFSLGPLCSRRSRSVSARVDAAARDSRACGRGVLPATGAADSAAPVGAAAASRRCGRTRSRWRSSTRSSCCERWRR